MFGYRKLFSRGTQMMRLFSSSALNESLKEKIESYVAKDRVVVFMKGTKSEPKCGFSKNVALVLDFHKISFKDYDVLDDPELRQGIKEFSEWPTIPQVYVNGTFVGGSDILVQLHKDGEITDFFEKEGIKSRFSE